MPRFRPILQASRLLLNAGSHLTRQMAGALLVAIISVQLILLWPSYINERATLLSGVEREVQVAVATALRPLRTNTEAGNLHAAAAAISEVRFTSHLLGGVIFDEAGNVVLRFGEPMYYQVNELSAPQTDIPGDRLEIRWGPEVFGAPLTVAARLDTSWIPSLTSRFLWRALGVLLMTSILVCVAAVMAINHMIICPLLNLRSSLAAAGKDPTNASQFAPPKQRRGVLGDLSRIIQQLLQRVSQTFREELTTFAAMAEQTGDAIFAYDGDGFLVYTNKACLDYCGVKSTRELKGLSGPHFRVGGSDFEQDLVSLLQNDTFSGEVDLMIPEREPLRCLMSATRLKTEDGRVLRTFASLSDITAIREAQWAVEEKNAQLEEANRIKAEFMAQMSHELRTPLNAIIGFSEILSDRPTSGPNDDVRTFASDINNSGHHLLGLINDILDLSKLEAGKQELSETNVDFLELADSALSMLRETARKNGICLERELPERGLEVQCDAIRIKQVLLNLLSNAVKFTDEGGTVVLGLRQEADQIVIYVSDTGIGMKPKDVPKALQPFAQVDSGFSRKFDGTGLGLPICSGLVELHGGKLGIESTFGEGTTVSFTLPISRVISVAA